ncbi:YIP1 family protein [Candidatus Bathyarchaeota archaeon]|nr:YIP1 family protein [Candidatus Bathyarchaeota archaeon]
MFATDILKVIYAPHKAFKGIIQNPKYLGPTLIVILFIAASMGSTYAAISKTCIEKTLPDGKLLDEWTENRTLWTSNAGIAESNDSMNGSYYGNKSIAFSITNNTEVWAQLKDIGPVNCSGPDGYSKLSFRIKWTNPEVKPANATIQLLSTISSEYFSYNLTGALPNFTYNVWNNLTLPLISDGWSNSSSAASWDNITGLKLDFAWVDSSNITLVVDGVFFRGNFNSLLESAATAFLVNYAFMAFTQILLVWVILTGLIYLMGRGLGGSVLWKPVLIVIGFTLVPMVIQSLVNTAAYLSSPTVHYPLELIGGVSGESDIAFNAILEQTWLTSQIMRYTQVAVYVWTIALCSLAVRVLTGFGWAKSFLIGAAAYLITLLAGSFLLGS